MAAATSSTAAAAAAAATSSINKINFVELADTDELTEFLNDHPEGCVIAFSATWCGPCKASKPKLQTEIAPNSPVPIGYVHEEDIENDFFQVVVEIKAFPTYVYFVHGQEVARVQGADLKGVKQMIQNQQQQQPAAIES